jgi:hypothetical protein
VNIILCSHILYPYRLLEHLAGVAPNTASCGLDSIAVALLMAALQGLDASGAEREDLDIPLVSGNRSNHTEDGIVLNCI